jgi:hypothetical protein
MEALHADGARRAIFLTAKPKVELAATPTRAGFLRRLCTFPFSRAAGKKGATSVIEMAISRYSICWDFRLMSGAASPSRLAD